jgi:hypothetical protein
MVLRMTAQGGKTARHGRSAAVKKWEKWGKFLSEEIKQNSHCEPSLARRGNLRLRHIFEIDRFASRNDNILFR